LALALGADHGQTGREPHYFSFAGHTHVPGANGSYICFRRSFLGVIPHDVISSLKLSGSSMSSRPAYQ